MENTGLKRRQGEEEQMQVQKKAFMKRKRKMHQKDEESQILDQSKFIKEMQEKADEGRSPQPKQTSKRKKKKKKILAEESDE